MGDQHSAKRIQWTFIIFLLCNIQSPFLWNQNRSSSGGIASLIVYSIILLSNFCSRAWPDPHKLQKPDGSRGDSIWVLEIGNGAGWKIELTHPATTFSKRTRTTPLYPGTILLYIDFSCNQVTLAATVFVYTTGTFFNFQFSIKLADYIKDNQ